MATALSFGIVHKNLTTGSRNGLYVHFSYGGMPGCCGFHMIYSMYKYSSMAFSQQKKLYPILCRSIIGQLIGNEEWANPEFEIAKDEPGKVVFFEQDYTNGGYWYLPVSANVKSNDYRFRERIDQSRAILFTDVIEEVEETTTRNHRTLGFYDCLKDIDGWHFMNTWVHNSNHSLGRAVGVWMFNPTINPAYSIDIHDLKAN